MSRARSIRLLHAFLWLAALQACGQNKDSVAIRKYYEENAILWTGGSKYYKNNQSFPLKNLKEEFTFSKEASLEISLNRKNQRVATIGYFLTEALLFSSLIAHDPNVKLGLLGGSLITLSVSIPFSNKATTHLSRSIWLYNRDILLR